MSNADDKGKPQQKGRRKVSVDGTPTTADKKRSEPRALKDILGDPNAGNEIPDEPPKAPGWNPIRLEQFLRGQITLGDLEGITKHEQYEMAKIGFSYLTSGKLQQARTVFEGLLALDPFDAYFHTAIGSIAQQENKLEEAEERYTRALEINPFSPIALANRGEVRITQGRLADGATDLVRALEEDPNGVQPSTLRARATIQVVREQLSTMNLEELSAAAARNKTGSKIPVVATDPKTKTVTATKVVPVAAKPAAARPAPAAKAAPAAQKSASAATSPAQPRAANPTPTPARAHPRSPHHGPRPGPRKK
jgi:tetratricopeptide (TPR) repeat protein